MILRTLLTRRSWFTWITLALAVAGAPSRADAGAALRKYETKYYILHTDLDRDMTRQAVVRITAMAEEYRNRTRSFAGRITARFPLYLYKDREGYNRHPGAVRGSAGVYTGHALAATAPRPGGSWRVVQHEGFHQFAHRVIRGRLPVWLNEGLAEYFGYGVWTGDNLVVGLISKGRLSALKEMIEDGKLMPLNKMLDMSRKEWNSELRSRNYLQAWSMVHFLVHADRGKYQEALSQYIRDLSKGRSSSAAFGRRFGSNTQAFEICYSRWWTKLKDNPSAELYDRIKVLTLTSCLARAWCTGRKFKDFNAFVAAVHDGTFDKVFVDIGRRNPVFWLPTSLLKRTLPPGDEAGRWSIPPKPAGRLIRYVRSDGSTLVGGFSVGSRIKVKIRKIPPVSKKPTVKSGDKSASEK